MVRPKLPEEEKERRKELTRQKNRERALRYYHEHKTLKEDNLRFSTLEEYINHKKQYYKEYYQQHKKKAIDFEK
jgi:hypothetical protein